MKYRISAEFYLDGDSSDDAEDNLYAGLSQELKNAIEVSDIWGYDD